MLACAFDCSRAATLQASAGEPDLSGVSADARTMIDSACSRDRYLHGPAAYYNCVRQQLATLQASVGEPDLSGISSEARTMIDSACSQDRYLHGPAAYYNCVRQQLGTLQASVGEPDLSGISPDARTMIDSACSRDRYLHGPAAYYNCVRQQLAVLPPGRPRSGVAEPAENVPKLPAEVPNAPSQAPTTAQQDSRSRQRKTHPADLVSRPSPQPYRGAPTPSDKADSVSDIVNKPAAPRPRPEPSSDGELTLWLAVLLVVGFLARVLYKRATKKKCIRCGNSTESPSAYCPTCSAAMAEAARRASEQRAAEQRARADEQRRAWEAQEEEERRRVSTLADLHRLTGPQFEDLIASLFRKDGYTVRRCGGSWDEGIDLVLVMGQEKDVVQCKRWKNDIGSPVVRDFYGALMHAAARHGFIITTASFSPSARDFARGNPITLVSGAELLRWIAGTYSSRDQAASRPKASRDTSTFDPYAVLGISRDASPEEVRAAYRREMVNYHPDKVAHLGKELQELAKTKAQEINRAYEELAHSR